MNFKWEIRFPAFLIKFWRYTAIKELIINEKIDAKEVRLIGADGTAHGIVSLAEAQQMADREGLDLALISPTANPPVCKIMDYGKYRFEQLKKEKEARKKQKVSEVKEMQLSLSIQENDLNIKSKKVRSFLEDGDKVKVALRLRGREIANAKSGLPIMENFFQRVEDIGVLTSKIEISGRQIIMVISPKNTK